MGAQKREALGGISKEKRFSLPGDLAVLVFEGEELGARNVKPLDDSQTIHSLRGYIDWCVYPKKHFRVIAHYNENPGALSRDLSRDLVTDGASSQLVLIALNEHHRYMERSAAAKVLDSTVQRLANVYITKYKDRLHRFRNILKPAIPDIRRIEALWRDFLYLLAICRAEAKLVSTACKDPT